MGYGRETVRSGVWQGDGKQWGMAGRRYAVGYGRETIRSGVWQEDGTGIVQWVWQGDVTLRDVRFCVFRFLLPIIRCSPMHTF